MDFYQTTLFDRLCVCVCLGLRVVFTSSHLVNLNLGFDHLCNVQRAEFSVIDSSPFMVALLSFYMFCVGWAADPHFCYSGIDTRHQGALLGHFCVIID